MLWSTNVRFLLHYLELVLLRWLRILHYNLNKVKPKLESISKRRFVYTFDVTPQTKLLLFASSRRTRRLPFHKSIKLSRNLPTPPLGRTMVQQQTPRMIVFFIQRIILHTHLCIHLPHTCILQRRCNSSNEYTCSIAA